MDTATAERLTQELSVLIQAKLRSITAAFVVRSCTEDLDVVRRHNFLTCVNERCKAGGWCHGCDHEGGIPCEDAPWPCPEFKSIARRYQFPLPE